MFGFNDLRPQLTIKEGTLPCPVRGCPTRVPVQQRTFRRAPEFFCPPHRLYIGRSTFEYERESDNLLSQDPADLSLLAAIRSVKRESRMARERSEDALTWNVFRQLERRGRLVPWLAGLVGTTASEAAVHYWSFDAVRRETWRPLAQARSAFGEAEGRGSEPDLIISTSDVEVWVEAKFGSGNDTRPSDVAGAGRRYTSGGGAWYAATVKSAFQIVAVEQRRYELLRLWLLGSWAAAQQGKRFVLLNLVRDGFEEGVPSFAALQFHQSPERLVRRVTWESVVCAIEAAPPHDPTDSALLTYMSEKTMGYGSSGRLLRAFAPD